MRIVLLALLLSGCAVSVKKTDDGWEYSRTFDPDPKQAEMLGEGFGRGAAGAFFPGL